MSHKNIVVLGSVNQDHTVLSKDIPAIGETIQGHSHLLAFGGKGANQAVAAARLKGHVKFIACVGTDGFGRDALQQFAKEGIDISCIEACDNENTGIALILVDDKGNNVISISANANAKLNENIVEKNTDIIKEADYLLTQLETPLGGVEKAVDIAINNNTKVILNPAPAFTLSDELLSKLYLITPNETESESLTGVIVTDEKTAHEASLILLDKGVENVIITLGEKGAFYCNKKENYLVPTMKVKAIDTVAAGDTFNGALLVGLCNDMKMKDAITFANKAAALSVTKLGAQPSIPTLNEVNNQ